MATPTAHIGAQSQNDIDRNVRQYKDLDLFFGTKQASNDINKGRDYESSSAFNASICLNTLDFYHFFNNGVWSSKIHQKSPKKCRHSALDS